MNSRKRNGYLLAATLAALLATAGSASTASAYQSTYPPDGDHPLRILYTFVAPVGNFLEWTVTRPISRLGDVIAPYQHIDDKGFRGCSRERPARSCTNVVK